MDSGTLTALRSTPAARLDGELAWWMDADGRIYVGGACAGPGGIAGGRVCQESRIGVIETLGTKAAVLGILPRGVIDALGERFPGVRWAVADVTPTATQCPGPVGPRPRR